MGKTIAELEQTLTRDELLEWIAFYGFEPFGTPLHDQHFESLMASLYQVNSERNARTPEFFPRDVEGRREKEAARSLADKMADFFSRFDAPEDEEEPLIEVPDDPPGAATV